MKPHGIRRSIPAVFFTILLTSILGCNQLTWMPTPTATIPATRTSIPTATRTDVPQPSPTATAAAVPTSSLMGSSVKALSAECRSAVDGLSAIHIDLTVPDHFMKGEPLRQAANFDPNEYFKIYTHLNMQPGYKLDYVYFADDLGGKPVLYARQSNTPPYKTYADLLESYGEQVSGERSYSQLGHAFDYLGKVEIDQSPESYFQFTVLALLGDQFYLFWHGLYNDTEILCDPGDLKLVEGDLGFDLNLPADVLENARKIDFTPAIRMDATSVTVRFVTFTKWGGFYENIYKMDRRDPFILLDSQFNSLVHYDCGIAF